MKMKLPLLLLSVSLLQGHALPEEANGIDLQLKTAKEVTNLSGVRASLFPNVPPYYKFVLHNESISPPWPKEVRKHLTWRKERVRSKIVQNTVKSSGFTLVDSNYNVPWGKALFNTVEKHQKLNYLPGARELDNKALLWLNLNLSISRHGIRTYDFVPRTFLLPGDKEKLKAVWAAKKCDSGKCLWVSKPTNKANGAGVHVITNWSQIKSSNRSWVVQEYIRPMLIQNRKFDLRLYALVTSFKPLRAYFYRDGFVRFAVSKYSAKSDNAKKRQIHLTNRAINKRSRRYVKNDSLNGTTGLQWSVQAFWRYLEDRGVTTEPIKNKIEDVILKTLISVEGSIGKYDSEAQNRYNSYQLYGFDIGIDNKLRPWLFEVNVSPGMGTDSGFLKDLKGKLVTEYLNIAGYHFPPSLSKSAQSIIRERLGENVTLIKTTFDGNLYTGKNSLHTKRKHVFLTKKFAGYSYRQHILKNLTGDDLRELITAEDELTQCDGFVRIFPSTTSHRYLKYFQEPHYHNLLLEAWEQKYASNRSAGISKLKEACAAQLHLKK